MSIIQQPTLFDLDILMQLDIEEKYTELFSPIELSAVLKLFEKESRVGPPITVNYEAALRSMMVRFIEKIPTIHDLVTRLENDLRFKLSLGFLYSQPVPSESTYTRIGQTLAEHPEVLETLNETFILAIQKEFGIFDEPVSIDATAIPAYTKHEKTENPKLPSAEAQRNLSTEELLDCLPIYASWGVKKNSKGKNDYWFGYKGHFAVSSQSQYLLSALTTSAFVADLSVAIPLFRKIAHLGITHVPVLLDKGYDVAAHYHEAKKLRLEPIIPLKKIPKNDGEVDEHFTPTCLLEHAYQYDSFDKRYGALKFTRPQKHCRACPLQHEGLCQKIIKVKQMSDPRKHAHPARGTRAWQKLYNQRSAVERVNAYLKEDFQLGQLRFYRPERVQVEH
ncbi:transposase [Enterococcus sp. DIV0187]|uniref:transposase n=1 Tax=Enterococcus sp. DIV0187 TaxID=2774644 RepID=UPI003F24C6E4